MDAPTPNTIHCGDCLEVMRGWPDGGVDCIVTSPPYYGLRDYGVAGQIGLERSIEEYIAKLVAVFREARRVLKPTGTLWLNLGDSYASSSGVKTITPQTAYLTGRAGGSPRAAPNKTLEYESAAAGYKDYSGYKPKDLMLMPARVALALQADGWWLRSAELLAKREYWQDVYAKGRGRQRRVALRELERIAVALEEHGRHGAPVLPLSR